MAFARLPAVLGRLAGAGAVAVTPATGGGAEAPRRPLVPGSIHCEHATGEKAYEGFYKKKKKEYLSGTLSPLECVRHAGESPILKISLFFY